MHRRGLCSQVLLLAVLVCVAAPVMAQLSDADIAVLQQRAAAEGWTFTVGENGVTHLPLESLCGLVPPTDWEATARFVPIQPMRDLPTAFDWRAQVTLPPVRNQGGCGSCWAFGTIAPLECNIAIKDGQIVDLSEQWLVSCNDDGWGCGGGWWAHDYLEWKTDPCGGTGAPPESAFPYVQADVPCVCPLPHDYLIDAWGYIGSGGAIPDPDLIKQAIVDYGPVSVTIYVNSAFQGYTGGVFNYCTNGQGVNHGVALVGWGEDANGGYWILRNSWGPNWGENGYMRIRFGCSEVGYAAAFVQYSPAPRTVAFSYPEGYPELLPANQPTTFTLEVGTDLGVPVPGTAQLHYAIDGGAFMTTGLTETAPNVYDVVLPPLTCGQTIQWYVSAEETTDGRFYDPPEAPTEAYGAEVVTALPAVFADDFETDQGWSVDHIDLTGGFWERGLPAGDGTFGDPTTDFDGSGACYLTGNAPGNSDLDGGPAILLSPVFDLSAGGSYRIRYAAWFANNDGDEDRMWVTLSCDGGRTWFPVHEIGVTDGWLECSFDPAAYLPLKQQMRVRFLTKDQPNNSITEAAVDAFRVVRLECSFPPGDLNCDGQADFDDVNPFVMAVTDPATYATTFDFCDPLQGDFNHDGVVDVNDVNPFVILLTGGN